MELNDYMNRAIDTASYDKDKALEYLILGLAGEAGEIANKYKKVLRGDKPLDAKLKGELAYELGDVLWYVAVLAHELGYPLGWIAGMNISKLEDRIKRGVIKGDGDER